MSKLGRAAHIHHLLRIGTLLRGVSTWSGVLCLCLHRVGEPHDPIWERELRGITAEELDSRLTLIRRHADVISAEEMLGFDRPPKGRHVLLTFDDGYRGWATDVLPVLRAHRVAAIFFITTGLIDRPRGPWWYEVAWMVRNATRPALPASHWTGGPVAIGPREKDGAITDLLKLYKSLPGAAGPKFLDWLGQAAGSGRCPPGAGADSWLTWDGVRTLSEAGMEIGGHTVNHPVLSRLPAADQRAEVAGAAARLEAELGRPMRTFSYPIGGHDSFGPATEAILRDLGVELAFAYDGGFARHGQPLPRLAVPRVTGDTDRETFEALLTAPQLFGRW